MNLEELLMMESSCDREEIVDLRALELMDCPGTLCDKKTRKKDLSPDKKCMHELHQCSRCDEEVMEQDYENARLDSLELTIRHLQQRNEIFEDGLANIRSTLLDASHAVPGQHTETRLRPSGRSGSPDPPHLSGSPSHADHSGAMSSNAATTTYLLALHESLREEVGQLSHAITDLDARASMAIMNECLRIKEDMAHTNAAVSSIRMQIQWLMNPRLHQGQRAIGMRGNNGSSNNDESRTGQLGSSTSGPSSGLLRPRRPSDSGREGTKL
ncbi:hypothetical protein KXV81_003414 [Aspergillus fumigatus]|nr:hypothetical protein KXW93_000621 [Aspergillus fumigatus]KAH2937844.1 hypothetical protein KXW73_009103 [Aspergillus fumigatus]KAH3412321.1 hypothetical protein KXV81_003414 [Aspergillus fumigatus]OXN08374.1 hypothetical protein CDV58_02727 [Aspergillus fumigatus]